MAKIVVVNTHPFSDKKLMDLKNDFVFVSTTGPYQGNKPKYDIMGLISREQFNNAIKETISLKNMPLLEKIFRYTRILRQSRPDVVFCNIAEVKMSLTSFIYSKLAGCKLYYYNEFWIYPKGPVFRIVQKLSNMMMRNSDGVYCIGSLHRKYLREQGINNVIKIDPIYHRNIKPISLFKKKNRQLRLCYVGRIVPYKGLDRLLRIFNEISVKHDIALDIVGSQYSRDQYPGNNPDYERDCRDYVHKNGLGKKVRFFGYREDPLKFIKNSDLVILPNTIVEDKVPAESWGIVCAEALLAKKPVVSTNAVASAVDLIKEGVNGYVVGWDSEPKLGNAIKKALRRLGAK
jgi:glycosyltransferase involved in cell wall biosynthesis